MSARRQPCKNDRTLNGRPGSVQVRGQGIEKSTVSGGKATQPFIIKAILFRHTRNSIENSLALINEIKTYIPYSIYELT
jgi:hypothetical protein